MKSRSPIILLAVIVIGAFYLWSQPEAPEVEVSEGRFQTHQSDLYGFQFHYRSTGFDPEIHLIDLYAEPNEGPSGFWEMDQQKRMRQFRDNKNDYADGDDCLVGGASLHGEGFPGLYSCEIVKDDSIYGMLVESSFSEAYLRLVFDRYALDISVSDSNRSVLVDIAETFMITDESRFLYATAPAPFPCTEQPIVTDIGSAQYPIDSKYKDLYFLGQLFTADDCGEERVNQLWGIEDEQYILGAHITLWDIPSNDFAEILHDIGFECDDLDPSGDLCFEWKLTDVVSPAQILKLKPYHEYIKTDDCVNCG